MIGKRQNTKNKTAKHCTSPILMEISPNFSRVFRFDWRDAPRSTNFDNDLYCKPLNKISAV